MLGDGNVVDCIPAEIVFDELYEPDQVIRLERIGEGGLGHCLEYSTGVVPDSQSQQI